MIRTGIVGFGFSAQTFHLPFLSVLPDFEPVAVVSSQQALVGQLLPQASCYSNIEAMLRDADLDLVVITTPNDTHYDFARQALEADCHVLLEKPFVVNSGQGLDLLRISNTRGKILCPYQNRRWDGDFQTVKSLIDSDELGKVRVFESNFDRFRPEVKQRWREQPGDGAGILYDLGSHLVDQALFLFGEPLAITAHCKAMRNQSKATDYFHMTLHYSDKEVILNSSPFRSGKGARFVVQGDKATFSCFGLDVQEQQLRDGVTVTYSEFGRQQHQGKLEIGDNVTEKDIELEYGCYSDLFAQLASAILNGTPPPVDTYDAVKVIYALELAEHSSQAGRTERWEF
ncbi:myo-inositol 2-dehydrogenase [Enterovibrio norvegicus FF-33]|uniref:Myo-inositol 2-dehydrogenase n=1 Tax=Enterovibrio norvegicus FF-454 TaxID=1185651 RepID=A0A1E5CC54_9GAMM|nr:Gfo/Idh/MocA family oxidoreductase [Enterovibrio norvegicus]OEE63035.1 myo-inositol 2-dehydrogenase [Enterovibrio norvegicus FF-454]OEE66958.1 myo-inositol 2-dehydrogenase [Enterovibrio norvegicus FF-33]